MIIGFCMGVCGGFAIPVAQQFGAQKYEQLRRYVYNGYLLSVVFSIVLTALSVFFLPEYSDGNAHAGEHL